MPAIERIAIAGFKSMRNVEVKLGDINVLIGANGSGKSNFLEVLSFLQAIRGGDMTDGFAVEALRQYVVRAGGAGRVLHFGASVTKGIDVRINFRDPLVQYNIYMSHADADSLGFNTISASLPQSPLRELPLEVQLSKKENSAESLLLEGKSPDGAYIQVVSSWRLYHFHDTSRSAPIKKTAALHDNRYLRADGSNLAAFLYLLREKHDDSYRFLRNTVRLVAPFFDDFVLEPLALNEDTIRLEWKHVGTDAYFDVSSFSDGTLRFIALAALLQQPVELRPSVILLDEPELGLHPLAITMLASMIKTASVDTQVILATQSPDPARLLRAGGCPRGRQGGWRNRVQASQFR